MRSLLCILFTTGCTLAAATAGEEAPPSAARVEADLGLELGAAADARLVLDRLEDAPALQLALRNRSETASYPVVLPGDGSECGWREPSVHWELRFRAAGSDEWQPVGMLRYARCGLFDHHWQDEVVTLAPGAIQAGPAWNWIPAPWHGLNLSDPGTLRVQAVYRYSRGRATKARMAAADGAVAEAPAADLGAMAEMPAFTLRSNALDVAVLATAPARAEANADVDVPEDKSADDAAPAADTAP